MGTIARILGRPSPGIHPVPAAATFRLLAVEKRRRNRHQAAGIAELVARRCHIDGASNGRQAGHGHALSTSCRRWVAVVRDLPNCRGRESAEVAERNLVGPAAGSTMRGWHGHPRSGRSHPGGDGGRRRQMGASMRRHAASSSPTALASSAVALGPAAGPGPAAGQAGRHRRRAGGVLAALRRRVPAQHRRQVRRRHRPVGLRTPRERHGDAGPLAAAAHRASQGRPGDHARPPGGRAAPGWSTLPRRPRCRTTYEPRTTGTGFDP